MAKKILFVEDEPDILTVAAFRLKKAGYEVITAVDGQVALEKIEKENPDMIFLDLRLPVMNGYNIAKKLKGDERFKNIPIVLFTASSDRVQEKVKETGADDWLIKPFEPEALLEKVKKFIG